MGFFSLPHMLQRNYAAGSLRALKFGYAVMAIGPWVTQVTGVLLGTVAVQVLRDESDVASPFAAMAERVMEINAFGYALGLLLFTATLAAIMSTAGAQRAPGSSFPLLLLNVS